MKRIIKWLKIIDLFFGTILLTIFLISVLIQMFTRYIGVSATWTEEVAMYAFIWSVFLGASAMVSEKKHFAFSSLSDKLKNPRHKLVLELIISICMLFFGVLMIYYGLLATKQYWNHTWINLPNLKRGPIWACIPTGGLFICIFLIDIIIDDIKGFIEGGSKKWA